MLETENKSSKNIPDNFSSDRLDFVPTFSIPVEEYNRVAQDLYNKNVVNSIETSREIITRQRKCWEEKSVLNFAILDKTGNCIGAIDFDCPDENGVISNIGYWLGEKYRGKGYATETLNATVKFIKINFPNVKILKAFIKADNDKSRKVLEKCKFVETKKEMHIYEDGKNEDRIYFELVF